MDSNFKAKEVMCVADETAKVVNGFIQNIEHYMLTLATELSDVAHLKNAVRTDLELSVFLTPSQVVAFRDKVIETLGIVDGVVNAFHKFTIMSLANHYGILMLRDRVIELRIASKPIPSVHEFELPPFDAVNPALLGKNTLGEPIPKPIEKKLFDYELNFVSKEQITPPIKIESLKTQDMLKNVPLNPDFVERYVPLATLAELTATEVNEIMDECRNYASRHAIAFFEYLDMGGITFKEDDLKKVSVSLLSRLHKENIPYGKAFMLFLLGSTHAYWRDCKDEEDTVKWLLILNNSPEVWGAFKHAEENPS